MVGSGPFKLATFEPGRRVMLEKFDKYFLKGKPYLDKIVIDVTPDVTPTIVGFERDMLITEVEYVLDDKGTVATLHVVPPEAVQPEPNDKQRKRKLKKGGKADNFEYLLPADWEKQ